MSHPGTRGFWRMVNDARDQLQLATDGWYDNNWQHMADAAKRLEAIAHEIATEAQEVAEREAPHKSSESGEIMWDDALAPLTRECDIAWHRFWKAQEAGHWQVVCLMLYARYLEALARWSAYDQRLQQEVDW